MRLALAGGDFDNLVSARGLAVGLDWQVEFDGVLGVVGVAFDLEAELDASRA
jgi:hypothetical protein